MRGRLTWLLYFNTWFNICFNTWFVWAAVVTDINTDPSYSRTRDPEMAISSSLDPDIVISLAGSAGLLYWHGPSKGVVPGLQHGPR